MEVSIARARSFPTTSPNPNQESEELGFIAQDMQDALPEPIRSAVVRQVDLEGHVGITYDKLTAIM